MWSTPTTASSIRSPTCSIGVTEPALRPIRSILPNLGGIDISPVILILFLLFIRDVVLLGWILPAFVHRRPRP